MTFILAAEALVVAPISRVPLVCQFYGGVAICPTGVAVLADFFASDALDGANGG